jgi:hypothetical protein
MHSAASVTELASAEKPLDLGEAEPLCDGFLGEIERLYHVPAFLVTDRSQALSPFSEQESGCNVKREAEEERLEVDHTALSGKMLSRSSIGFRKTSRFS